MSLGDFKKKEKKAGGLAAMKAKSKPKPKSPIRTLHDDKPKAKRQPKPVKKVGLAALVSKKRDLEDAEHYVEETSAKYYDSMEKETEAFKVVDKLDLAGKKDTKKWYSAMEVWEEAMKLNDRAYSAAINAASHLSTLKYKSIDNRR